MTQCCPSCRGPSNKKACDHEPHSFWPLRWRSARQIALSIQVRPPESPTRPAEAYRPRNSRLEMPVTHTVRVEAESGSIAMGYRRFGDYSRVKYGPFKLFC